jgi:hypothetical protein
MQTDLLDAAYRLKDLANQALDADKTAEWMSLLEMAFSSAMAAGATLPISLKLLPKGHVPAYLAMVDHLIAQISRRGIVLHADLNLVLRPVCDLRRFPLVGALLSRIAGELRDEEILQGIIDIGDGTDTGAYPRLAFSSARADAVLVPDPYFFFNDNNSYYRAYAAQNAKPWTARRDVIFWRGGSGGPRLSKPDPAHPRDWSCQQRLHLCQAARDCPDRARLDIALSHANTIDEPYLRISHADRCGWVDQRLEPPRQADRRCNHPQGRLCVRLPPMVL